ncbi:uncharacterized protein LOC128225640 [Mya arenaria]|uniref:uncharacterized protein LOC128225640 n=1 Tax=Mya arenaria TaxID=6604 RepID=UPI0022E264B5|nr:uncharacterized protein LOC128225640 [Mya arenaria]
MSSSTMMMSRSRDVVSRFLEQTISTLCRDAVKFNRRLEIEGVICVTVDNGVEHVVKIRQQFKKEVSDDTSHTTNGEISLPEECASRSLNTSSSSSVSLSMPMYDNHKHSVALTSMGTTSAISSRLFDTLKVKSEPEETQDEPTIELTSIPKLTTATTTVDKHNSNGISLNGSSEYDKLHLEKMTISTAKNILCKKCGQTLEEVRSFETHNVTEHGHFTCLICLSTFTSRNNMKRHIRLHTGVKPYRCHKCSESFSRNDDFKRHLLRHSFQKPYRCATCQTGYADRVGVKSHMMKDHGTASFHVCSHCGECFTDLWKFKEHRESHADGQDYRCSLCAFVGSNALMYNKHMLTHGSLRKYMCTHCDVTYSDPFGYTEHLKKHKGDDFVHSFQCCFCDLTFPSFEQFQRHEHTHVQSRQHTCSVCQKQFRYPSNLREHMLTHIPKSDLLGEMEPRDKHELQTLPKWSNLETDTDFTEMRLQTFPVNLLSRAVDLTNGTVEENNNVIDGNKREDGSNEAEGTSNGSSEYWCAECQQGFGSETYLQRHISSRHEQGGSDISLEEEMANDVAKRRFHDAEMSAYNYVMKDLYEDDSRSSVLSNISDFRALTPVEKEDTKRSPTPNKRKSGIPHERRHIQLPKRARGYENENSNDASETPSFQSSPDNGQTGEIIPGQAAPLSLTHLKMFQSTMKQVQKIQAKFGLEPAVFDLSPKKENDDESLEGLNLSPTSKSSRTSPKSKTPTMSASLEGMKLKIRRETDKTHEPNDNDFLQEISKFNLSDESNTTDNDNTSDSIKPYSKSSVLGMDTEFSTSSLSRSSPTTINLKVRNPGFEKVVTPEVLFSTKAPFTCELCEETFDEFETFDTHGVKVHRRFLCSYCGKAFTSRPNRERHVRYHTGEKPYTCDLCPSSFFRGDDLKYHRTTKHADVKPFLCGACQTSFSFPKELEKHLRLNPDHKHV